MGAVMKVVVVIPVGPGHADLAIKAIRSVAEVWIGEKGPFSEMHMAVMMDLVCLPRRFLV